MNNYNLIKDAIEKIFLELKVKYNYIDIDEDDDINYLVTFNTYGKLKSLNSVRGVLYLHHSDFSINLLVPNVFTLEDTDDVIDTLDIYEAVNDINSGFPYGSFLIEDNKHIFYRSSIICGENYTGLNKKILKKQFDIFISGLEWLFTVIKSIGQSDE